jgi:hypothetical protein
MPSKLPQTQCCIGFQRYCSNSMKQNFLTNKTNKIMKTANNSKTAKNSLTNKTNKTMKKQIAPVSAKATKVARVKTTKVVSEQDLINEVVAEVTNQQNKDFVESKKKTTKVVSLAFQVPTSTKVDYRNAKKALTKTYKDEIGSISFILNFVKTNPKGIAFTSQFINFNVADLTPKNMFSVMKDTERYLTQIFDLNDGTTERRISYDIKGEPMKRERFSIGTIENCIERFYANKHKESENKKANVKEAKGAKAPVKNQISKTTKAKA